MFKNLFKLPVYTETSPNMQWDDIFVVLKTLFTPWSWNNKKYNEEFEKDLKNYIGVKNVILADSGRTSLLLTLKGLGIEKNDEVILPAFTCLVVANVTAWTEATPIYVDSNQKDYNFDLKKLEEAITPKTRAIVVQHTFGKIVDIDEVKRIIQRCKDKFQIESWNPYIIEDWAHALSRNQEVKGDIAFLTFGIEKLFSTIRGGAIITNNDGLAQRIRRETLDLQKFPSKRIIIALLNPLFWWIDVPLHKIGFKKYTLGAAVRIIWRKLGFLGIMIEKIENRSIKPIWYPAEFSPALARLGINQLKKLDKYNEHRLKIAGIYHKYFGFLSDEDRIEGNKYSFNANRVYIRYPILLRSKEEKSDIWEAAKALKVSLGAWYKTPLYATYASPEAYSKVNFHSEQVPITIDKCSKVLNLPTSVNISEKRARELAEGLKEVIDNYKTLIS